MTRPASNYSRTFDSLPAEMTTIIRLRRYACAVRQDETVPRPPNLDDHFTLATLRGMSRAELRQLRDELCDDFRVFSAMGGDEYHRRKGWRTNHLMTRCSVVGWQPREPIHDEHEYLVWLCWELLVCCR